MKLSWKTGTQLLAAAVVMVAAVPALADFTPFVIRDAATFTVTGPIIEFVTDVGGEKAGLGSNDINGFRIGDITGLGITRTDDTTRYPAGSGPAVAPYFNIWITDGLGNFAVVANEPSNPAFQTLYNNGYDLTFADLSNKVAKIYENNDKSWLPNSGVGLTFADLAGFVIQAPTVAELTVGWLGLGNGAPRDAANNAYGVNWVFGDTLTNYVTDSTGYVVSNAFVTAAVPEPMTLALFGAGLLGIGLARRRRAR